MRGSCERELRKGVAKGFIRKKSVAIIVVIGYQCEGIYITEQPRGVTDLE